MIKTLNYADTADCWICVNCRAHRIDRRWLCNLNLENFGNPKIDEPGQCKEFIAQAGTDRDEYENNR